MTTLSVTVSRVVASDPTTVYAVLADVTTSGDRSPENLSCTWLDEQRGVGARFRGRNRIGAMRWSTVATVTEAEPGRVFAFVTSAPSSTTWRYELKPVAGGTLVTESMRKDDRQPLPVRILQRLAGVRDREAHLRAGMETTLARLG